MKKKRFEQRFLSKELKKLFCIMKLTFFLFLLSSNLVWAAQTYAQVTSLNLELNNVNLEEVFEAIRQQSEFEFFYNNDQVNTLVKVSVEAKEADIEAVLEQVLPVIYEYKIKDRYILINKRQEEISSQSARAQTEVQQQKKTISGKIVDEQGEPVIGANIMEQGTTNGTITDFDGNFSLNIEEDATLRISYIGYITQDISTEGRTSINIILQEDLESLDELIVIGYGIVRKKDLTGSVAQLGNRSFKDLKVSHPTEAMAGRLAGVQIQQVGGQPGQAATIRVRGSGSITASSAPLYVVDGYPLGEQNLNMVNPNDIESIEVLKDASAAAIYGSRAANGVVLITTKSGQQGRTNISLDMYWGMQNVTKKLDLMDAQEFTEFSREAFNNHYLDDFPNGSMNDPVGSRPSGYRYRYPSFYDDAPYVASLGAGTDWQDEI